MDKAAKYKQLTKEIESLIDPKLDLIGNMANVVAAIHTAFNHHWTGFYRVVDKQLMLGPFQGPVACTRIGLGKGVCGKAWQQKTTQVVPNVHTFEGHIACSPYSNSEIVVPLIGHKEVIAVLDIDSTHFENFDASDKMYLEHIVSLLNK